MSGAAVRTVEVWFTPSRDTPLAVWSGMYLYRTVLDAFNAAGVAFDHRARKPFRISPILDDQQRRVVGGLLRGGEVYSFVFSAPSEELTQKFVEGLTMLEGLHTIRLASSTLEIRDGDLLPVPKGPLVHVTVAIRFYPTLFRFRGASVLYPSIPRLLMSVARDASLLSGVDLRRFVTRLLARSELLRLDTRITRLHLGRDGGGRERSIRAFCGRAEILFAVREGEVRALLTLLKLASALGVGKNRALGLGHVKLEVPAVKPCR